MWRVIENSHRERRLTAGNVLMGHGGGGSCWPRAAHVRMPHAPHNQPTLRRPRSRAVRRRRRLAALAIVLTAAAAVAVAATSRPHGPVPATSRSASRTRSPAATRSARPASRPHSPFAVGLRFEVLVDHRATVHFADGTVARRTLLTEIRYPALGRHGTGDLRDAPPARAGGPFPLIIFGHGFGIRPGAYAALMRAWVRAGYVVAAPLFPGENPRAPGGPTANDLPNEPGDMSFVITSMLDSSRSPASVFHGLIDGGKIAVSGQSDGGDTALAVAYDARTRDRRIGAAMILSGATIPQLGPFAFPAHGPPLLATQGSADPINLPSATNAFFTVARRPKYLLTLIGAQHLPPYTTQQPQLGIIERVTIAFLAYCFDDRRSAARRALAAAGDVPGLATLQADP